MTSFFLYGSQRRPASARARICILHATKRIIGCLFRFVGRILSLISNHHHHRWEKIEGFWVERKKWDRMGATHPPDARRAQRSSYSRATCIVVVNDVNVDALHAVAVTRTVALPSLYPPSIANHRRRLLA